MSVPVCLPWLLVALQRSHASLHPCPPKPDGCVELHPPASTESVRLVKRGRLRAGGRDVGSNSDTCSTAWHGPRKLPGRYASILHSCSAASCSSDKRGIIGVVSGWVTRSVTDGSNTSVG